MTPLDRFRRTRECYRAIAGELDHHLINGSEWLHLEADGSDSPLEVVELRFKILRRVRDATARKGGLLFRGTR